MANPPLPKKQREKGFYRPSEAERAYKKAYDDYKKASDEWSETWQYADDAIANEVAGNVAGQVDGVNKHSSGGSTPWDSTGPSDDEGTSYRKDAGDAAQNKRNEVEKAYKRAVGAAKAAGVDPSQVPKPPFKSGTSTSQERSPGGGTTSQHKKEGSNVGLKDKTNPPPATTQFPSEPPKS